MNSTTNKVLWAVGTVIVAVLICMIFLPKQTSNALGAITSPGTQLDYLNLTQGLGFGPNAQTVGSASTNISGTRAVITSTSPVLCSMANPFNATSTIINVSANITTGVASAQGLIFAIANSATATTTVIGNPQTLASSAIGTFQNSGIASTTDIGVPVGPGQFLNVGTTLGAQGYAGQCNALFESAN